MTGLKLVRWMQQLSLSSAVPHNYRSKGIFFSPNGLSPRGINQIMLLQHCHCISSPPSPKCRDSPYDAVWSQGWQWFFSSTVCDGVMIPIPVLTQTNFAVIWLCCCLLLWALISAFLFALLPDDGPYSKGSKDSGGMDSALVSRRQSIPGKGGDWLLLQHIIAVGAGLAVPAVCQQVWKGCSRRLITFLMKPGARF